MIHTTLDNQTEVVIKENHFTRAVAVQCWVGTGSLDERPEQRGMAHYLEHMLFKGTSRRPVGEIAAAIEAYGGEINAYTSFDQTVYYLTLGSEHWAEALDILHDAIYHSTFDPEEFERERQVILEEIRRGLDNPGALVGRKLFELAYAGTEAGRPIIGSEESVRSFTREGVMTFHDAWYRPANLKVVVVGDIEAQAVLSEVERLFGREPDRPLPPRVRPPREYPRDGAVAVLRGDYQQPRLEVAFAAPPLEDPATAALDLASFALGAGEMSRLSRRLRDRDGSVIAASASLYSPAFGGIFSLSAFATPEAVLEAAEGLGREIGLLRGPEPVTPAELERARANLQADRVFRDETVDGQARNLGQGLLTSHKVLFDDVYAAQIHAMPEAMVEEAVRRHLDPRAAVLVALVPNDHPLTEAALVEAFRSGAEEGIGKERLVTLSGGRRRESETKVTPLGDGLKLVYRHNPDGGIFAMTLASEGGLRDESAQDAGIYHAMSGLLGVATKRRSYEEVVGRVEALGAGLEGFSGKDSFGMHLQCLPEQVEELLDLAVEALLEPEFPEEQWGAIRREIDRQIASQDDSPAGIAVRRFQEEIFGDHPYRFPLYGTAASTRGFSAEGLRRFFESKRDAGPWVIAAAGPLPPGHALALIEKAFSRFRPSATRRALGRPDAAAASSAREIFVPKAREQLHILYGFPGLTWGDPDRAALDVLINVLGGHGGRLFRNLRDKDGLAYTVTPVVTYGCHPGAVGSYIATSPANRERATTGLKREMLVLAEAPPSDAEIERAKGYIVGTHELSLQKSDSQTSTMALMELYGYGYDDFLTYPDHIRAVTAEDVRRVAERLFRPERAVLVKVGPEG